MLFGVKGSMQAFEDFLKNPHGDRHPLYDPYDPLLGDSFLGVPYFMYLVVAFGNEAMTA